ncbi:MAG TPA: tRNA pseudouridine(55) synthase TruB [Sedimentisphaerales bacterium]|nr:tRNA pseudouridine(55) synthase TruB [Sedimentisphaerales bacterium]HQI26711.1 tRNA pseudouridine(55) synthase TruB [Sedimentisphaerales bacterium]
MIDQTLAPQEGIFAVYKDEGMTSHDVIDVVRRVTRQKRVGHAGTLDPCAKGVLVVAVGRAATKTLGEITGSEKEYITRVKLGWRSTTDDREGDKEEVPSSRIPTEEQVRAALAGFEGVIHQRPPIYSALKVGGRAAYKLARAHKQIELSERQVEAKVVELIRYEWPWVDVRLVTGSGFYVRSFARDLGEALGTGGYVDQLERTRVGAFTKEQAVRISDLQSRSPHGGPEGPNPDAVP